MQTHMYAHTHTYTRARVCARKRARTHTHTQTGSWDSVIGIVTKLRAGKRGGARDFCKSPDRLWVLPSLLSNGYQGLFPRA